MPNLQTYIFQVQRLIRDRQGLFTPQSDLVAYINEARNVTALTTGCIRRVILGSPAYGASAQPGQIVPGGMQSGADPNSLFYTINGVERYPFQGFANSFLQAQYQGVKGIVDVITCAVSWGGAFRPVLDWMPWEEFQSQLRATQVLVTSYPSVFSVFNDGEQGEIWLYPVPQSANEMEWDCFCVPAELYTNSDVEILQYPFANAVQYYAAGKCMEASGRPGTADRYFSEFARLLGLDRAAVDRGKIPQRYPVYI